MKRPVSLKCPICGRESVYKAPDGTLYCAAMCFQGWATNDVAQGKGGDS